MGRGQDLQDEIPDAEEPETGRHGFWEHQGSIEMKLFDSIKDT